MPEGVDWFCWMIHRLRLRRISPAMLDRKLKSKRKVAVLDLLNFEEETEGESSEAIPRALRVDPARLRKSPHITVPDDVEIILYSSSGGDTLSARVAVALKRIGVDKVWVLEGGLKAWREPGTLYLSFWKHPKSLQRALELPCQPISSSDEARRGLLFLVADAAQRCRELEALFSHLSRSRLQYDIHPLAVTHWDPDFDGKVAAHFRSRQMHSPRVRLVAPPALCEGIPRSPVR